MRFLLFSEEEALRCLRGKETLVAGVASAFSTASWICSTRPKTERRPSWWPVETGGRASFFCVSSSLVVDAAVSRLCEEFFFLFAGPEDWTDEDLKSAAAVIGYGAVKFFDLKQSRTSDYAFSYDRMLDPKGK